MSSKHKFPANPTLSDHLKQTPFSCSGKLTLSTPLRLFFCNEDGSKSNVVHFPSTKEENESQGNQFQKKFEDLLTLCSPATFGQGQKDVYDESVRKALALKPTQFAVNFHPSETDIFQTILKIMAVESSSIRADLYKLNIYPPGGHFKAHVDTPRGGMIGSLVIALPFPHEGGALKVTHKGSTFTYDFSKIEWGEVRWASFFSDCEHQIETVTSGYRITLTYNVYQTSAANLSSVVRGLPLYNDWKSLLLDSAYFPRGALLAFSCSHSYSGSDDLEGGRANHLMLKGSDALLYATAVELGCSAFVKSLYAVDEDRNDSDEDESLGSGTSYYVSDMVPEVQPLDMTLGDENNESDAMYELKAERLHKFVKKTGASQVVWCTATPTCDSLAGIAMAYGNEHSLTNFYFHMVVLILVPPYPLRAQQLKTK